MPVQVIIKRKLIINNPQELIPLLSELHSHAIEQPGYLFGETLRSIDNPEDYMVVSKWETADDWTRWFQSKERREIQGRVDSILGEKTFYETFESLSH
jgi:heme-degrading monooxygenase HmoA